MCTKNYENPSIFVKVTAKKSVAPFFLGHGVGDPLRVKQRPGIVATRALADDSGQVVLGAL